VIGASYAPSSKQASLEQIATWIARNPERLGVYAFLGARMMERDALPYVPTFDRILRAAVDAGLSERTARTLVFRGFAAAAAGHPEPPPELEEGGD
jgi:hypothetical protein